MSSKSIISILCLSGYLFFAACSSDAPVSSSATQQQTAPTAEAAAPDTSATPEIADTSASELPESRPELSPRPALQPGETPIDEKAKSAPGKPSNNEVRSKERPSDKVVQHNSPFKPNTTAAVKKQNPAGNATGFIGRENIGFYSEPSASSQKVSTLKLYESVIILETKMTDESGKTHDMPQWYKVQLTNKKIGWVVGTSLTLN